MKLRKLILTAVLLTALVTVTHPAQAAPDELSVWAGGGTDVGTTLCYSVMSANSRNSGTPVLTYLNATSDKAASVVQFYTAGQPAVANYTNSTTTLFLNITNSGTAFTTNAGIVVIRHKATDTYERRILQYSGSNTNLSVTVAPTAAVLPGDVIYPMTTAGSIPVGNATLSLTGTGIYAGQKNKPLLFEVDGTSACQVNAACGSYVP